MEMSFVRASPTVHTIITCLKNFAWLMSAAAVCFKNNTCIWPHQHNAHKSYFLSICLQSDLFLQLIVLTYLNVEMTIVGASLTHYTVMEMSSMGDSPTLILVLKIFG